MDWGSSTDLGRRRLELLVLVLACIGTGLAGVTHPTTAAGQVGTDVGVPVTYLGHTYAAAGPPTADKPQSKLWHLDGSWWALMVEQGGTRVTIHQLMANHTWRNTGTVVDVRAGSTGDALWSARDQRLYVASRAPGSDLQVSALSYSAGTWNVVQGYPETITTGGTSESATIDQDSLGRLWVTYTRASRVWVAHSNAQQGGWTPGFQPSVPDTTIGGDDLSALIAFGNSVGVLYSDQQSGGLHFAIHDDADPDTVWRSEHIDSMPFIADDHINLKQLVGDPQGRIFAAIKTSAEEAPGAQPSDALVGVLTRTPGTDGVGSWEFAPAGTVADDHTRPLIMVDATNKELYFFATAPVGGGDIFYKKAPLADVRFAAGRGTPFINAAPAVNNASGAKDPVTAATGMVLIAVAHGRKQYVHGEMSLAGGPVEDDPPTVTQSVPAEDARGVGPATTLQVTFSEPVQGVNAGTFTLRDATTGAKVAATVSQGSSARIWRLDPSTNLVQDRWYTVTLTGGPTAIRDLAGTPLVTSSWQFLTGPPPRVTVRRPLANATGVGRGTTVAVTFSEPVTNVTGTTFTLTDPGGAKVAATVVRDGTTNRWILDPNASLREGTRYTVRLVGGPQGITDLAGNPLTTAQWSFTTTG